MKYILNNIIKHREEVKNKLGRDLGLLVSTLDYLTNISCDIKSPKIIDDLRIEEAALMATRDYLTGLYLRSVFDFSIVQLFKEHKRYGKVLSVIMLDIDNFKNVNDNFGHITGDKVIKKMGKVILKTIRDADFPARYGGEEIGIILPETPEKKAIVLAERLRKNVNENFSNEPIITVSIGVASNIAAARNGIEMIRFADKALYAAKLKGKNRVGAWPN